MAKEIKDGENNLGIIFIHGAGLGGWIWRDVALNISLPYVCADYSSLRGSNQKTASPNAILNATLIDYVDLAYKQTQELNVEKIIIVAHSIGGIVGVELLKRLGEKAAGFIGICAAIPKPGNNFISTLPFPQRLIMPVILKLAGTKPPESAIRSGLGSDLSKTQSDEIVAKFQPESIHLYIDKISNTNLPHLPTFYIRTTLDKEFGISVEGSMIENLPNAKPYDIASGHMPMLSQPIPVSKFIRSAIEELRVSMVLPS